MDTERYRTAKKRIWAAIVDRIVFMPFLLVDKYLIYPTNIENIIAGWQIFTIFIPIFYSVFCHYKYGQTIGKFAAGIKVLNLGETRNISFKQSLIRDAVPLGVEVTGFIYYFVLTIQTGDKNNIIYGFNDFARIPFLIWTIAELVTMVTNDKRRAIQDYLAGSIVVRVN